jgi:hypothetical protein
MCDECVCFWFSDAASEQYFLDLKFSRRQIVLHVFVVVFTEGPSHDVIQRNEGVINEIRPFRIEVQHLRNEEFVGSNEFQSSA